MLNDDEKENLTKRLKRIQGQVSGIQRMVEGDRYCVDVMTQVAAARAALARVNSIVLESHMHTCVASAFESEDPSEKNEKIKEIIRVFEKNYSK